MVFHRKQKQIEPLHFSIDGEVIENVSSFTRIHNDNLCNTSIRTHTYKGFAFNVTHVFLNAYDFLGITLDESLTWKNHIDLIKNKISKTIRIRISLFRNKKKEVMS